MRMVRFLKLAWARCSQPSLPISFLSTYSLWYLNLRLKDFSRLLCSSVCTLHRQFSRDLLFHRNTDCQSGEVLPVELTQMSAAFRTNLISIYISTLLPKFKVVKFLKTAFFRCSQPLARMSLYSTYLFSYLSLKQLASANLPCSNVCSLHHQYHSYLLFHIHT